MHKDATSFDNAGRLRRELRAWSLWLAFFLLTACLITGAILLTDADAANKGSSAASFEQGSPATPPARR